MLVPLSPNIKSYHATCMDPFKTEHCKDDVIIQWDFETRRTLFRRMRQFDRLQAPNTFRSRFGPRIQLIDMRELPEFVARIRDLRYPHLQKGQLLLIQLLKMHQEMQITYPDDRRKDS